MTEIGPMREDRPGLVPAEVVYTETHGHWSWRVYQISRFGYDVYAHDTRAGRWTRLFKGSYRFRYFAKRACRRGKA
jgi:hypothetical protein